MSRLGKIPSKANYDRMFAANRTWLKTLSMGQLPQAWSFLTAAMRQHMTREEADECIAESFPPRDDAFEYHLAEIAKLFDSETMSAELDRVRMIAKDAAKDKP